jgi:hypothetical protein
VLPYGSQDIEQFFIDGRENLARAANTVFIEWIVGPPAPLLRKSLGSEVWPKSANFVLPPSTIGGRGGVVALDQPRANA